MGDLRRFVVERLDSIEVVGCVMRELELAFESSETQEVISVSFLENMDPNTADYARLREHMGPLLKAELEHLQELWE